MFNVQGILNAAPLAFIYPALSVMKLQNERILCLKNAACLLTALFGAFVLVVGGIMALLEISEGLACSHGAEPAYCPASQSANWTRAAGYPLAPPT